MKRFVFILFVPLFSFSQIIDKPKLDSLVNDYGSISLFTGIVQISKNGKLLYESSYGFANRELQQSFNSGTRFNIASGGKSFTATLIMQLVEQGKIDLQTPISVYLPNCNIPNGDKINVHHLLTHTSGLSDYMLYPGYFDKKIICNNIDEVIELIKKMPLDTSVPGIKYRYSNSGYIVLGKILERIYEKSYWDIMEENILRPLGITDLSFEYPVKYGIGTIAKPYNVLSNTRAVAVVDSELPPFSDGGFIMSSTSLVTFFEGLNSGKLLRNASLKSISENYLTDVDKLSHYGFIPMEYAGIEGMHIGLSGGSPGFTVYVEMNLKNGLVISVCANNKFKSQLLIDAIRNLLYHSVYKKPRQWVIQWLIEKIESNESLLPDLRTYVFKNYGRDFSDPIYFIETAEVLQNAHLYLESEKLLFAIVDSYNHNSYAYSALGTFYLRQKQLTLAKDYFNNSIQLDSTNPFALKGLTEINGQIELNY